MAADDTRPVSADASIGANPNGYRRPSNFTSLEHYPSGFGVYTDNVRSHHVTPFGVGEFIWSGGQQQGRVLSGSRTSTMTLRQKDASDIRPYTLLSGGQLRPRREDEHDEHRAGWPAALW